MDVVDASSFRHIIGHFPSGVTIVTVADEKSRYGATASAVCSLSLNPPMLLVCLHSSTETSRAIAHGLQFVVNILREDQGDLALHFASKVPNKYDDLRGISYIEGQPALAETLAQLRCSVEEVATGGTHSVFMARVRYAKVSSGAPLAYFRGSFGHFVEIRDDFIYRDLRTRILQRTYRYGDRLNVDLLAEKRGLNRSSLVYALTRLSQEGLVHRVNSADYSVTPVDQVLLQRTLDARRALSIGVIEAAIDNLTPDQILKIQQAANMTVPTGADETAQMRTREAVHVFHSELISLSNNPITVDFYNALGIPSILTRTLWGIDWSELQQRISTQYVRLGDALSRKDRIEATAAINEYSRIALDECSQLLIRAGGQI